MVKVLYYITEVFKFLIICRLGFAMPLTDGKIRKFAAAAGTLVFGILFRAADTSNLYPVLYTVFIFGIYYLLFENAKLKDAVLVIWSVGVMFSVDTISYALLRAILDLAHYKMSGSMNLYTSLITLLILIVLFGTIGYKRKAPLQELSTIYFIAFFIICIVNASVLVAVEMLMSEFHKQYAVIYIMLVLSSLVQMAFVLVLAASNNWHRRNEELKEQYLQMQRTHYQYLEERNLSTKKFRHDMRAHIYVMKQYIREKRYKELDDYADTICGELEYIPGYISVKNGIVDAILNYYNEQFSKKGCVFKVNGNLPLECRIHAYDLCTIFSNVLLNAVEAAAVSDKKYVELSIRFDDDLIYVREKNSYSGTIKRQGDVILTSKDSKEKHGFGISNIRDSVNKYKGSVDIELSGHEFIMDIVMENIECTEGRR